MFGKIFLWAPHSFAGVVLFSAVANVLGLTGSIYMLQVYDRVLPGRSIPTLVSLTLIMVCLYGFYALMEVLRARMLGRFAAALEERYSQPAFNAVVRLRLANRTDIDPLRDLAVVRQFTAGAAPLSLMDLPWLPLYLGVLFLFSPVLGWVAVAGGLAMTSLVVIGDVMARAPSTEIGQLTISRHRLSGDAEANPDVLVSMGMTQTVVDRWLGLTRNYLDLQVKVGDQTALFSSMTKAFRLFLQSAVLGMGAYLVVQGQMTGGLMIGASILTARALAPLEQVTGQWRALVAARQSWKRLDEILTRLVPADEKHALPAPSRTLAVAQVHAGARGGGGAILSGITFEAKAGEGIGILGASGSGKSTLARTLIAAEQIRNGTVRLDGSELQHFDVATLGRSVGYLPQTVELFDGTVAENIARFHSDATSDEVMQAAQDAHAAEFIAALDEGYNTRLVRRGANLSTGTRQRIGLARAMFRRPFLLVLDEPNSNLDSEGDQALRDALMAARQRGSIVVVVAHRPSAIAAVDKILYLHAGQQVMFGPKADVLNKITRNSIEAAIPAVAANG